MDETKGTIYTYLIGGGAVCAFSAILVFPDVGVGGFEFPPRMIGRTQMRSEIAGRAGGMEHVAEITEWGVIETVLPMGWDREAVLTSFDAACEMAGRMIEGGYDGH